MKFLIVTCDEALTEAAREGFHPSDEFQVFCDWRQALEKAEKADMMFVDLEATLVEPHRIQGYEEFAEAKMRHPKAAGVPVVLIAPAPGYDLDFMAGWPGFLLGHVQKPITYRTFRRASTWV